MQPMKRFEFQLSIPAHAYLDYYRGAIKQVRVVGVTGETLQFPAALLTRFVTETGVHGRFVLTCDDDNKGAKLERLA
jgi:hypothetical protein